MGCFIHKLITYWEDSAFPYYCRRTKRPPLFFLFTITSANDFLVTVTDGSTSLVFNIYYITGVGFILSLTTYNITSACRFRGDYNCRERPIRELLDTLIGSTVNLLASTSSTAADFIVKQIGLGISTCKITTVNFLLNLEMYNKR